MAVLCVEDCKINHQITAVKQLLGKDNLKSLIHGNKQLLRTQNSCLDLFSNYFVLSLWTVFVVLKTDKGKKEKNHCES